ncbi:hypothetical protein FXV77_21840 [Sphingobacterium phlebotomi]|uniref:Uncharacterized protein n=1 Tax=Sphingobacterium phlebotomi TaxID=2605433 RepID=A0A5D4GRW7_9SPHI|nr:hypothetical protein [Sphingobacterium phlebotomi]TYR30782.1 hypothetical protein FXV77_21840 [Sphingobacterium phlebotomi]
MKNIVILFVWGLSFFLAGAQEKPRQVTVKNRPNAIWFNEGLADSLKSKRTLHLDNTSPIQAIISDRQNLYIRIRGQEVNTLLNYRQGEKAQLLDLKFDEGSPLSRYKGPKVSDLKLEIHPDEVFLNMVRNDGITDTVKFRLLREPLSRKDFREIYQLYLISGKYIYVDSLNQESTVCFNLDGTVSGLDHYKNWTVNDTGVPKPDNMWSSAKTRLTLRGKTTKSYYIELEPHTRIWYLYDFEVDRRNVIHLKGNARGKLISPIN